MTHRFLLQFLAELCQSVKDQRLPEEPRVFYPNETIPAEAVSDSVFYEVFTGDETPVWDTERTSASTVVGSIVINGKLNIGISLFDAIAEALTDKFLPCNPYRKIGFVTPNCDGKRLQNVYVTNVERSEGGVDGGRYKITIFITFEIYED